MGTAPGSDRLLDQLDDPGDAGRCSVVVEVPVDGQALVGPHAPEHVEHGRRHPAIGLWPFGGVVLHRPKECVPLSSARLLEGRVQGRSLLEGVGGDAGQDPARNAGYLAQLHPVEVDAGFLLQLTHDRILESPLGTEVTEDGALTDAGMVGHRPDGQTSPVPDGRLPKKIATGGDDPGPGLVRLSASQRIVVGPAQPG